MILRFPALLAAALILAGCGSREVILDAGGAPVQPTAIATPSGASTPSVTESVVAQVLPSDQASARATARPTPRPTFTGGPADHNTMPLEVTLSRTCARRGDLMQATATTRPGSKLAFVASYSSNEDPPDFTYIPGEGNPTGTFTYSWEITPTRPYGEALMTVVAAHEKDGASYEAPFRVAETC